MKMNEWLSLSENSDIFVSSNSEFTHYMYSSFDEYCEGSLCTASVKFKLKDGSETEWYHPPKTLNEVFDGSYLFGGNK